MPHPPRQPARAEIAAEDIDDYEKILARARSSPARGGPDVEDNAGFYGRLLASPRVAASLSELSRYFRGVGERGDSFSHADREFIDQVLSAHLKTNIVIAHHVNDALSTGVRIEAIEALRAGRDEDLTPDERLLAEFIRRVVDGRIDQDTWLLIEDRMGERGVIEYAAFTLHLHTIMRFMHAVGIPAATDEEVDSLIAEYATGAREPDDFRKRIAW